MKQHSAPKLPRTCGHQRVHCFKKSAKMHTMTRNSQSKRTKLIVKPLISRNKKAFASQAPTVPEFHTVQTGNGMDYRVYFFKQTPGQQATNDDINHAISPWHQIPLINSLQADNIPIYNFVCEIPKGTRPKYEIAIKEDKNPIKQDIKNGQLRNFTYGDIPFNYGALPQTWENPNEVDHLLRLPGDNDPIDVVELSPSALQHGGIYPVKVVGIMGLLDDNEADWKVLAIDVNSPLAKLLNEPIDLDNHMPAIRNKITNWFKYYKTTDGKSENSFGFNDDILPVKTAHEVIQITHTAWKERGDVKLMQLSAVDNHSLDHILPNDSHDELKQ